MYPSAYHSSGPSGARGGWPGYHPQPQHPPKLPPGFGAHGGGGGFAQFCHVGGQPELVYVGQGGDYTTELKYVGHGAGEYDLAHDHHWCGHWSWWWFLPPCCCLCCLLPFLLWALFTAPTTTTSAPFDCAAHLGIVQALWSEEQRQYCCEETGRGCEKPPPVVEETTTTFGYNCWQGLGAWARLWSEAKKAWCCEQEGRGCPSTTTGPLGYPCAMNMNAERQWSSEERSWCCAAKSLGCPLPETECENVFEHWNVVDWSHGIRHWCCTHCQSSRCQSKKCVRFMDEHVTRGFSVQALAARR